MHLNEYNYENDSHSGSRDKEMWYVYANDESLKGLFDKIAITEQIIFEVRD